MKKILERHGRILLQPAEETPYYARVDGVYIKNKLFLIELELIEPYLYFQCAMSKNA